MLFLYRIHQLDEVKRKCLTRFVGQYRSLNAPKKLFLICHNSDEKTLEFCRRLTEVKDIDCVEVKCDGGKLFNGVSITNKHYTLYKTSIDLALEHSYDVETIHFIEDDYIFAPDAFTKIDWFCKTHLDDFVTGLDHSDRYQPKFKEQELQVPIRMLVNGDILGQNYKNDIHWRGIGEDFKKSVLGYVQYYLDIEYVTGHHWKTAISSCHTFSCSKNTLLKSEGYFLNITEQKSDHQMWSHLWGNNQKLWAAIPGLCVHLGHSNKAEIIWPEWSREVKF